MFVHNYQEFPLDFFCGGKKRKEFFKIVSFTHTKIVKNRTTHFYVANFEKQHYYSIEDFEILK